MADREEELRTELLDDPPPREPAGAGTTRLPPAE